MTGKQFQECSLVLVIFNSESREAIDITWRQVLSKFTITTNESAELGQMSTPSDLAR
jgi:hypothetical protein